MDLSEIWPQRLSLLKEMHDALWKHWRRILCTKNKTVKTKLLKAAFQRTHD